MSCLSGTLVSVGDFTASIEPVTGCSMAVEGGAGIDMSLAPSGACEMDLMPVPSVPVGMDGGGRLAVGIESAGGSSFSLEGVPSVPVDMESKGRLVASFFKEGGLTALFVWVSDMTAKMEEICSINVTVPYLEIEPEIIWVVDGWAANDVLSNTRWNVD